MKAKMAAKEQRSVTVYKLHNVTPEKYLENIRSFDASGYSDETVLGWKLG